MLCITVVTPVTFSAAVLVACAATVPVSFVRQSRTKLFMQRARGEVDVHAMGVAAGVVAGGLSECGKLCFYASAITLVACTATVPASSGRAEPGLRCLCNASGARLMCGNFDRRWLPSPSSNKTRAIRQLPALLDLPSELQGTARHSPPCGACERSSSAPSNRPERRRWRQRERLRRRRARSGHCAAGRGERLRWLCPVGRGGAGSCSAALAGETAPVLISSPVTIAPLFARRRLVLFPAPVTVCQERAAAEGSGEGQRVQGGGGVSTAANGC